MLSFESFKQKSPAKRFLFILSLLMFLFFVVVGGLFMFSNRLNLGALQPYKVFIGGFFILYGFLRMWTLNQRNS